jgi:dTDP-4-amino-4,6-dideoxygalactose transaminase
MIPREVPPTAGLPPRWRDLWGGAPETLDLAGQLEAQLGLPMPQIECSGTAALIVALSTLRALRQNSRRDEVIIPAYTCPLVALAVAHCGLRVRLCDLAPDHFDLNLDVLATLMNERTLAVIPTHLGGRVADVRRVQALAALQNISVIEDAAQALGAQVGEHGDISFFSLAAGKGLSLFEGGILTTRDSALRQALRQTSQTSIPSQWFRELRRCLELIAYTACYRPRGLHYAYGLPRRKALRAGNFLAAVGDAFGPEIPLHRVSRWRKNAGARALPRLPEFLRQTREQAQTRCERLRQIPHLRVMADEDGRQGVWPFLMVLMPDTASRDVTLAQLWTAPHGVTRLFLHALPDYAYLKRIVPAEDAIPHARDFAARMLTISNSPWLEDEAFEQICRTLEAAVG